MNRVLRFEILTAVLFLNASAALSMQYYAVGAWLALGCVACAWVTYRAAEGKATDEAATAITALRLQVQELRAEAQAHNTALATTDTRVAAVMSFLQATQQYTSARPLGSNGRPASPIKHPLRPGP